MKPYVTYQNGTIFGDLESSYTMGGARGVAWGAAGPLCPPSCHPLVRIMTLDALQGFSIFVKSN